MSVLGHRLRAYVPLAGFDPLSISGLVMWIDSNDAATFTYSSGVLVSQWNDKSVSGRHVSQGTTTKQPSRNTTSPTGKTTVAFSSARADWLTSAVITQAQPVTVFAHARYSNVDTSNHQIQGNEGAGVPVLYTDSGVWKMYAGTPLSSVTTDDASWHYFTAVYNGASSSLRLDGSQIASGDAGSSGWSGQSWHIGEQGSGGGAPWDGDIAEVLVYNSVLSTTDRAAVESYLLTKWGV